MQLVKLVAMPFLIMPSQWFECSLAHEELRWLVLLLLMFWEEGWLGVSYQLSYAHCFHTCVTGTRTRTHQLK